MICEPKRGLRAALITERRTKIEFAQSMRHIVELYPDAEVVRVVLDNLNTHTPAALYSVFSPEEARRITRKLEFHYTPKHGSWLNMAECEFAVLAGQCLNRRMASIETLREEIAAWQGPRNQHQTNTAFVPRSAWTVPCNLTTRQRWGWRR